MSEIRPIQWSEGKLRLLDQTRLPLEQVTVEAESYHQAVAAIRDMQVRGAPAIGVTAAYAVAMAAREIGSSKRDEFLSQLTDAGAEISAARPTAVNLQWAVKRMLQIAGEEADVAGIRDRLLTEAQRMQEEDEAINRKMGSFGKEFFVVLGLFRSSSWAHRQTEL